MRSRNIEFVAKRMKPLTRVYGFFDEEDVTRYCIPKLLEVNMGSGTFEVGETVVGVMQNAGLGGGSESQARITFRVATLNHREGPYDSPTATFGENVYNSQPLSATYSSTTTLLNVDTFSLQTQIQGQYWGWVATDMVLTGESSGAQATITDVRLISDLGGNLLGSFYIPNPNIPNFPRFETGVKTFKLTSDPENELQSTTAAGKNYTARGTWENVQETIISTRNATFETHQVTGDRTTARTLGGSWIEGERSQIWVRTDPPPRGDPLAQTFTVDDETGVFVTKCDIFFRTKDDMDIPCNFSIRTVENGIPTKKILPLSDVDLDPNNVNVSSNGSVATTFEFKGPVYLEPGIEYAMVLLSDSAKYSVYISRVGETDLVTESYVGQQPTLGALFKSQNASTWDPSQWEDLKFTMYRADFIENGTLEFYNPELTQGNQQIAQLQPNPLTLTSNKVRVGLGSTVADTGYELGNTFYQLNTNATGSLAGVAGTAVGTLNIINAGIGYTPVSGNYQYSGVLLDTITGNGRGATANIDITDGVAIAATISGVGTGYQVGDVLGVTTVGLTSLGRNMRLSVSGIGNTNELILENVQGDFTVGTSNTVMYYTSAGVSTVLNYGLPAGTGGDIQVASVNTDSDGLHIKVNHRNHGMYFSKNKVTLSDIEPDIYPTTLSVAYNVGDVGGIQVATATTFTTYENVAIGATNYGYLLIGDEIISYESVSGNTIGVTTRGIDSTVKKSYPVGTPVYKYEFGGIGLRRINRTHSLLDTSVSDPITFDSYNIKVDTSAVTGTARSTDIGFPQLHIDRTKAGGGNEVRATQNIPFEILTPMVRNLTPPKTSLTAEAKTTTSTSLSGSEIPWIEHDFESIVLNESNYLETPRLIGSKVNEDQYLSNVKGSKSLNMRLFFDTTDTRVSPVVDGQSSNIILTSNRVNSVITNYATDSRGNTVDADPTACQYISREMILENSATSLKILLAAHIHLNSDLRAFYALNNKEGQDPIFTPFPGYNNLNDRGQVIDAANNDGLSDKLVPKTNNYGFEEDVDFKEYVFTADNLPSFRNYRIKFLLTSTSQVYVPRVKELRVIALA